MDQRVPDDGPSGSTNRSEAKQITQMPESGNSANAVDPSIYLAFGALGRRLALKWGF
ncbi:MAG: hypothetical protein H6916_14760 [Novosphingobium sp.]|nr:hypothetical protein [Novosphingobium sp.]